jgi:hypothetical protein
MLYDHDLFLDGLRVGEKTCWTVKGLTHEDEEDDTEDFALLDEDPSNLAEISSHATEIPSNCEASDTLNFLSKSESNEQVNLASSYGLGYKTRENTAGISIENFEIALDIVQGCRLIIGMHPDQAAEHIVEFGIRNNVPFAVVPCCVYQKQFPRRKLLNGNLVREYAELIEYLLEKDPRINALELDFEGKNILLYFLADRVPLNDPASVIPQISKGIATKEKWWALSRQTKSRRCKCCL